jgi:pimeloyl-ACP methyl ester carboxylesterase
MNHQRPRQPKQQLGRPRGQTRTTYVRWAAVLAVLGATGAALAPRTLFYVSDALANLLLFHGRPQTEWHVIQGATCPQWLQDEGFENHPLTCEQALAVEGQHRSVHTPSGRKSHFITYPAIDESQTKLPVDAPLWVHVHGLNGNYLHGARYLPAAQRMGFQLISTEYVNHGLSDVDGKGTAYGCKESEDVVAILKTILTENPGREVLVTASSMGTMATALAAAELQVFDKSHALVAFALENPPTHVRDLASNVGVGAYLPEFLVNRAIQRAKEKSGFDLDHCQPMTAYHDFRRPTLVQHSKQDALTPYWMGQAVFEALPSDVPKELRLYPKGRHSAVWNAQPETFEEDLKTIFETGRAWRSHAGQSAGDGLPSGSSLPTTDRG